MAVFLVPIVLAVSALLPTPTLKLPLEFADKALSPTAVLLVPVLAGLKALTPKDVFAVSIFPALMLFLLNAKSLSSVVPMKLEVAVVPAFPANPQLFLEPIVIQLV